MADKSITKVNASTAPKGRSGQKYLAASVDLAMRMWEAETPTDAKPPRAREYEIIGYVISGRAELNLEGQTISLEPGDSWVVPRGSNHTYRILEAFTAIEVTHPPAFAHGRDE